MSRFWADVVDRAVTIFDAALASDLRRYELAIAENFSILGLGLLQAGNVPLGDDEYVGRRLRIDVFEDIDLVVLIDLP